MKRLTKLSIPDTEQAYSEISAVDILKILTQNDALVGMKIVTWNTPGGGIGVAIGEDAIALHDAHLLDTFGNPPIN